MNFGFRSFIGLGYEPSLKTYSEAEGDTSKGLDMPIPSMVTNVLRNIPSGGHRGNYATALKWIMTKGLYAAAMKRQALAKQASKEKIVLQDGTVTTLGKMVSDLAFKLDGTPRKKIVEKNAQGQIVDEYYPIKDHEMFSEKAHQFFASQGIPLKDFYDKTYGANPDAYEPDYIKIKSSTLLGTKRSGLGQTRQDGTKSKGRSADSSRVIKKSFKKLNDQLEAEGQVPFRYGGYNGLIEYMEEGDWAPPRSGISPTEFEHGSRQGYDLSNPTQYINHGKDGGGIVYSFNDFDPPRTNRSYNNTIEQIFKRTKNLIANPETPNHLSDSDKALLTRFKDAGLQNHGYSGTKTKAAHQWDDPDPTKDRPALHQTNRSILDFSNEPDKYAIISLVFKLGFQEEREHPYVKGGISDVDAAESQIYQDGGLKLRTVYRPHVDKERNSVDTIYNHGAKRLRRLVGNPPNPQVIEDLIQTYGSFLGPNPDLDVLRSNIQDVINFQEKNVIDVPSEPGDYSASKVVPHQVTKNPVTEEEIKNLISNGFQVIRTVEERKNKIPPNIIPNRDSFTLSHGDIEYKIQKDANGQWWLSNTHELTDQEEELPEKFNKAPRPAMIGGTSMKFNSQSVESTPQSKKNMSRVIDMIHEDPARFGYGYGEEEHLGKKYKIDDLHRAIATAASHAKSRATSLNLRDNGILRDKEALKGWAQDGLLRHSRSYPFYYGDLNSPNLPKIFEQQGFEDPRIQQLAIRHMKSLQAKRLHPDEIDKQIPDHFRPVFAINGKWWRQPKMKDNIIDFLKGEIGTERGQGDLGTNADGSAKQSEDPHEKKYIDQMDMYARSKASAVGNNLNRGEGESKFRGDRLEKISKPISGFEKTPLSDSVRPFTTDNAPVVNARTNQDKNFRHEYMLGNSNAKRGEQYSGGQFVNFAKSIFNKSNEKSEAYKLGVKDGIGDSVHQIIYSYLKGQTDYPKEIIDTFISPTSQYDLGKISPEHKSKVDEMREALNIVPATQVEPTSVQSQPEVDDARPLRPSIPFKNPISNQIELIHSPDILNAWYIYANNNPKNDPVLTALSADLRRKALDTKDGEYMKIVSPQQGGLSKIGSSYVPSGLSKLGTSYVPNFDRPQTNPQQSVTANKSPFFSGSSYIPNWGSNQSKPQQPANNQQLTTPSVPPWSSPNKNESLKTFEEFKSLNSNVK